MSGNNDVMRKKCEAILEMTVNATNALSPDEAGEVDASASAVADGLYLDIVAAGVKALVDVLKDRQS
jgi:hypothetical protein